MENITWKVPLTMLVVLVQIVMMSVVNVRCQRLSLPVKDKGIVEESQEATAAVLRDSWLPECSLIYVADGTVNSASFYKLTKDLGRESNVGVFDFTNLRNNNHKENIFSSIIQVEKSSRCTTIVLWSDEAEFLREFIEDAIEEELLVWPARLLVVTRLSEDKFQPMKESLSFINAIVMILKDQGRKRWDVYMYVPYSLRRALLASWTSSFGLVYAGSHRLFPHKFRRLMDGANMTVAGNNFPLHMFVTKIPKPNGEMDYSYRGPLVNLLQLLSENVNFTYNLIQPPDGSWGYRYPNGTWNGMIGMMIRGDVNFALGPFGLTQLRWSYISYTNPLVIDYGHILARRGDTEVDPFGFIMPLTPSVWAATFVTMIVIHLVAFAASKIDWDSKELFPKISLDTYIRAFLQQDITVPSDSTWDKLILGVWMLLILVLIECYSTNLTSLLAVRFISEPYQTIRDLLDDPKAKMVWVANTAYAQYLADVESGIFYDAQQVAKAGRVQYIRAPEYVKSVDTYVSQGGYGLFNPLIIMKIFLTEDYMENGNCKFYVSKETFLPQTHCMAVPKNSPLHGPVNEGIRAVVEGGLYAYWLDNANPNAKSCKDPPTKITVKAPLSFINIWGQFAVLVGGYIVSSVILLLEIMIDKNSKKT